MPDGPLPRLDLPCVPQYVVQRGNHRLPCFLDDDDRRRYLQLLREALFDTGVALHAHALMDNHVHLLVTPPEIGAVSRLMQKLGHQYVGQFKARHRCTGILWEGRYKSCLVGSDDYALQCGRYIDLNLSRARMTDDPVRFRSSCASCAANATIRCCRPIPPMHNSTSHVPSAPPPTNPCSAKRWRTMTCKPSPLACNNNARGDTMPSGQWSRPRPGDSPTSAPRIASVPDTLLGSESDSIFCQFLQPTQFDAGARTA